MSKGWSTSPSSAASTSASTKCARSCAASASGIRYVVGTRVRVQVSRVDLDGRKIDFRLVREGEEATTSSLRTRREKAAERSEAATSEIVALKDADRVVKAVAKAKARARIGRVVAAGSRRQDGSPQDRHRPPRRARNAASLSHGVGQLTSTRRGTQSMTIRFDGRVAIVTGAGGGLGRLHALALARAAQVVVNDLGGTVDGNGGTPTAANAVADEIRAAGGKAIANGASVTDNNAVQAMVEAALAEWGRVDILVNNAGILRDKSFTKMELDDFELVVDVHLMGAVNCTKAVWETMRAQNYGRIVMTTSSSGLYGNFGQANYGAAKMALVGLMQTLSIEGAKNNIRVNCLAPTAATRMTEKLMPEAVLRQLEAGAVTPGLLALVADDAPTRAILCAGAGSFERAHVTLTQGIHVGQHDDAAEQIALQFDAISDRTARRFPRAAPPRERSRSPRRCRRTAEGASRARRALSRRARAGAVARRGRRRAARPDVPAQRRRRARSRRASRCRTRSPPSDAQRPPIQPASTSPVPALASEALPVALIAGRAVGGGDDASRALQDDHRAQARRRARARRPGGRPARWPRVPPSRRAASSGCGVRIVAWPRARAPRRARAAKDRRRSH